MSDNIPVTLVLGTSLNDREVTNGKLAQNHCSLELIKESDKGCVSSFIKKWATGYGVDWLYRSFVSQKEEFPSNSHCENAVVAFGNGECIGVKVRQADITSNAALHAFSFVIKLFIIEENDVPILLHPDKCLYKSLGTKQRTPGQTIKLFACPAFLYGWDKVFKSPNNIRDTVIFWARDNELQRVEFIENDSHAIVPPHKKKKKPRKAYTAYTCFQSSSYKRLKEEYSGMSFPELSKIIGEQWRSISSEEKKKYEVLAAQDKARFEREMTAYKEFGIHNTKFTRIRDPNRSKIDPDRPKHTKSAYWFFCVDTRGELKAKLKADNPDFKHNDVERELSKKFKELTAEERGKYNQLSAKDKTRYEREMKVYNAGGKPKAEEAMGDADDKDKEVRKKEDEASQFDVKEEEKMLEIKASPPDDEEEGAMPESESPALDNAEVNEAIPTIEAPSLDNREEEDTESEIEKAPKSSVKTRTSKRKASTSKKMAGEETPNEKRTESKILSTKKKKRRKRRSIKI